MNGFRLCRSLEAVLRLRQREEHLVSGNEPKYTGPEGDIRLVIDCFISGSNITQVSFFRIWESSAQEA